MQRVRERMSELAKVHARALLPTFGTEAEAGRKTEAERQMERLTTEITRSLKQCEQRLQRLSVAAKDGSGGNSAICRNVQVIVIGIGI